MQGWNKNQHPMGDVRVYNPTPPETTSSIDLRDYQFKMVELKVNGLESGLRKYEFSIPPKTRALYHSDILYGAQWRQLIRDFDERLLGN